MEDDQKNIILERFLDELSVRDNLEYFDED
jgi:hypothetical protein